MTVAFYGFQAVPDVRVVNRERGWNGWYEERAEPLIEAGFRDQHVHNPFGLHDVPGRNRAMHIDQFELSFCRGLTWLADREQFAVAVRRVQQRGGTVQAYVGSPLVVGRRPQVEYLPGCSPGAHELSTRLRTLGRIGACNKRLAGGCLCWGRLIGFHISPLLEAGVDAIGFDDSADFRPGDCMDRLVRSLIAKRIEVIIEPWPKKDREYPRVSWMVRELRYHQIRLGVVSGSADVESVRGKVYRIVPADTPLGHAELDDINTLKIRNGEAPFASFEEVVDAVRADEHTPAIRFQELL